MRRSYMFYPRTLKILDILEKEIEMNKTLIIEWSIRYFYNNFKGRNKIKEIEKQEIFDLIRNNPV